MGAEGKGKVVRFDGICLLLPTESCIVRCIAFLIMGQMFIRYDCYLQLLKPLTSICHLYRLSMIFSNEGLILHILFLSIQLYD
ncbi:Metabotropic glutamate receptor [Dirofilaria immitis]